MQVSYNLLKEYVDIELSPDELADRLSMNGIVAEHSHKIFENLKGVIVGKIKEVSAHPQNKNLSVCLVDTKNEEFEVVCGARNMQVSNFIPFALEGAFLPGIGRIEGKNIQGVFSRGMICSAFELGLEKSKSSGVLILDDKLPLGKEINTIEGIGDDIIYDFEIFSNRPDLMSMIGIAREIAAFSGKSLQIPEIKIIETEKSIHSQISVVVNDPDLCPRYTGRVIKDLKVKESPFWLRWKLFLLGIRPICNVVDVTNYVMMETGQPLHAFDLDYIHGQKIMVRRAYPGERFSTLDGVQRELRKEHLVIADCDRAIGLAGVMGGENSEIKDDTRDVFLESAYFEPVNNRRTSQYFSLRTDASSRFEKGLDPDGQIYAVNRTASLIQQLASGHILSGIIDKYSQNLINRKPISLNFKKVKRIIGTSIAEEDQEAKEKIKNILEKLGFQIINQESESLEVIAPTFRGDVRRDVDLIEEIAKIYGYEKIPSTLFKSTVVQKGKTSSQNMVDKIENMLVSCGMHQMISYSMISPTCFDWMNLSASNPLRKSIKLMNPLIQDQTIMRTTLIPGILRAVQWNVNRKVEKISLFEIGKAFSPRENNQTQQLPLERLMIAGAITKIDRGNIWEKTEIWDIFYLKGMLESIFDGLRIQNVTYLQGSFPVFESEQNGVIKIGAQEIGIFGKVNQDVIQFLGIPEDVFLFELDFSVILSLISPHVSFQPLPRYPCIQRDIAVIVLEQIAIDQLSKVIRETDQEIIKKVVLFDIFRGKQIENGFKSVAFSLVFQAKDRTLTDEEVDKVMENVKINLKVRLQAELRR